MPPPTAMRRINTDVTRFEKAQACGEAEGLHFWLVGNKGNGDGYVGYGLIRGMSGPYHDGFYLIRFLFPKEYPFREPLCNHISFSRLRQSPNFHDNEYDPPLQKFKRGSDTPTPTHEIDPNNSGGMAPGGKVCLSRLNTWEGSSPGKDKWVASLDILYILRMIQCQVLTEKPLNHEPPYTRHELEPINAQNYTNFATYQNFRSNVVDIYHNLEGHVPWSICDGIKSTIFAYVSQHQGVYHDRLRELKDIHEGRSYACSTYPNSKCFCDYSSVVDNFIRTYGKIIIKMKTDTDK